MSPGWEERIQVLNSKNVFFSYKEIVLLISCSFIAQWSYPHSMILKSRATIAKCECD